MIASEFRERTLPDKNFVTKIYVHEVEKLVGLAGLNQELDAKLRANVRFAANWAIVANWSEGSRYEAIHSITATAMISAILEEDSGVLAWLKTIW